MTDYTFFVEHTVEAESEEEARKEFQSVLDNKSLILDSQECWGCYTEDSLRMSKG